MRNIKLFDSPDHQFILLNESDPGEENGIRSNQYLIRHKNAGVLLDPGGFGVMPRVLAELLKHLKPEEIKGIFLSHQDPDIVAGIVVWMEIIQAPIYISEIWIRFIPHYGVQDIHRFVGIPDTGEHYEVDSEFHLKFVPAHFLHSEGQMNVYDPISKILFTGDIGAACLPDDVDYIFVEDFDKHLPYIEGFHRRYMCGNAATRAWVETIADLEIEMLAPQHGPIYKGQAVKDFIAWLKELKCGTDLLRKGGHFHKEY